MQRSTLTYLIIREREDKDTKDLETFKERMIAAHPEHAAEILEDFDRAVNGEFADPIGDDEEARPLDANSLDYALEQMKMLGIGLEN